MLPFSAVLRASSSFRNVAVVLAASVTLPFVTPAFAQTDQERARARAAATAGAQAYTGGKWAEAVDLFTRAESLVHAPTHLLYLARAEEKLSHLVAAQEAYLKAVKETLPDRAPSAFREAQSSAQVELAKLQPRVPSLTVIVEGPGAKDATVTLDGEKIPAAALGVPSPADPGDHEIKAEVSGREPVTGRTSLKEGGSDTVRLVVEAPNADAPVAATPLVAHAEATRDTGTGGSLTKIVAYSALGVGVVGLGLGTFFVIRRNNKLSESETLCTGSGGACGISKKPQIDALDSDAKSAGTLSLVGFAVGGVGVATGIVLLVLGGKSKPREQGAMAPHVEPWIGAESAGVIGTF